MIKHIVMWTIQDGNTSAEKTVKMNEIKKQLIDLKNNIKEIVNLEVYFNSPEAPAGNYDISLISEFKSWNDLFSYQKNPLHVAVGGYIKSVVKDRSAIDFEY